MVEERHHAMEPADQAHERAATILAELIAVAAADRVYSEPVVAGDRTIITAAEIHTGMGFGYGFATGPRARRAGRRTRAAADSGAASPGKSHDSEGGPRSGGGGGGQAVGRPVAVITLGPDGVSVQPVLDRTKIALTALTSAGALGLMLLSRKRRSRHG